jgi:hypothetical protein
MKSLPLLPAIFTLHLEKPGIHAMKRCQYPDKQTLLQNSHCSDTGTDVA